MIPLKVVVPVTKSVYQVVGGASSLPKKSTNFCPTCVFCAVIGRTRMEVVAASTLSAMPNEGVQLKAPQGSNTTSLDCLHRAHFKHQFSNSSTIAYKVPFPQVGGQENPNPTSVATNVCEAIRPQLTRIAEAEEVLSFLGRKKAYLESIDSGLKT